MTRAARLPAAIDVAVLAAIFVGLDIILRGPGVPKPVGALAPIAILILVWIRMTSLGKRWRDFGLKRPEKWAFSSILAIVLVGINFSLAIAGGALLKSLGAELPDVSRFDFIEGNLPAYLTTLGLVWITAAVIEELLFRGFVLHRLETAIGNRAGTQWIAAIGQGALFGSLHAYQGLSGMILTGIVGVAFGLAFLRFGRNLWPLIIAHGLTDTISLTVVYADLA